MSASKLSVCVAVFGYNTAWKNKLLSCYDLTLASEQGLSTTTTQVPVALEVAMAKAVLSLSLTDGLENVQGHNNLRGGLLLLCFGRLSVVSLLLHSDDRQDRTIAIARVQRQETAPELSINLKSAFSRNHAFIDTSSVKAGNICTQREEEVGLDRI